MYSLHDTQSQEQNENELFHSQEIKLKGEAYGQLLSATDDLPSIILDKQSYVVGRSPDCDLHIRRVNLPSCVDTISKFHFKISCEHDKFVTITDLSKNGTFVNKTPVGKGKSNVLRHNDAISIGQSYNKVYVFKEIAKSHLPRRLEEQYEIVRLLGNGACAEVMLAHERSTNNKYAIKKIIKKKFVDRTNLNDPNRIANEVKILQSLKHPCIISTKDVIDSDEAVFIVLEYMAAGELTDMLSSPNPLPENTVKLIFYQLVIGLRYLHSKKITHRDLKPGNILLQSRQPPVVKIADFGLSKVIGSKSYMDTCCGTPFYVAPEVIDPRWKLYTQQVDVWSLGVVLFQMLSNELPFETHSNAPNHVCGLIIVNDFNMTSIAWNFVSDSAKDLIKKMLVKKPADRFTIDQVANHPWLAQDIEMQKQVDKILNNHSSPHSDDAIPKKKLKMD